MMDRIRTERHVGQLQKRREQIAMTLKHLGKERAEVERNTEWVSRDAYERRARLLSSMRSWYVSEIDQIDRALRGAEQSNYRLCVACNQLIEARHIEAAPESEFCHACQPCKDLETEL
jgi:RNA polymerase-binding transcription factor DksA